MTRLSAFAALALCLLLSACGAGKASRRQASRGKVIYQAAKKQMGRKYKFGGASPKRGFDCSGLAWWTHKRSGINIPRTAARQYRSGRKVSKKKLAAGDLVFFTTYKRGPSHVGIYTGRGTFIHAPKKGRGVAETRFSNKYWRKRYLGARRYY